MCKSGRQVYPFEYKIMLIKKTYFKTLFNYFFVIYFLNIYQILDSSALDYCPTFNFCSKLKKAIWRTMRVSNNFKVIKQQYILAKWIKQQMQKRCAHNNFTIKVADEISIHISSDFDSGNLQSVNLLSAGEPRQGSLQIVKLQLIPAVDPFNAQYSSKQSLKTFFHFSVKSSKNIIIYAYVRRMNILSIIEGSFQQCYRICVGRKKSLYQMVEYRKQKPSFMELTKNWDDYTLQFKYQIQQDERLYFAYHFPYSYQKMCHFLQDLDQSFKHSKQHNQNHGIITGVRGVSVGEHNDIYYRNQLLIQSNEGRQINLITITQISDTQKKNGFINLPREARISKSLFPYFQIQDRPFKFSKPYVMITSRVHPGQTSASYALEGLIKKLLSSSPQAEFLRKTFVLLIVPMINPDGVFHGTYRMDMLGHNLNRFYNNCVAHKQPSIFAINSLLHYHSQDLVGFFDIHSHPQAKGSFVYGNAYNSIYDQIQSQLFAKLLSYNSECFSYENSTFSQKNMNSKDINDILSKDGSARVCAFKKMLSASVCNGIHCYALQLGYHGCPTKKQIGRTQFKSAYKRQVEQFDVIDYMQIGAALIMTLMQMYIQNYRNSLTTISDSNSQFGANTQMNQMPVLQNPKNYLHLLRQEVSKQIYDKDERFRIMDSGLMKKLKNINNLSFSNFYAKIFKKYPIIQQNIKLYETKKNGKKEITRVNRLSTRQPENSLRIVHSLQLNKNETRLKSSMDTKKQTITNQQKFASRDVKNFIFRSVKQKINITPVQFLLPNPKNSVDRNERKKQSNFDQILEMQAQSLPRINKKKLNFLTERLKNKQRRADSSISNLNQNLEQKIIQGLPVWKGSLERKYNFLENATYENKIEGIIDYETYMNLQDQQQQEDYEKIFEQATQQYKNSSINPEFNSALNILRNEAMFRKQTISKKNHRKIEINHQTQRLRRKLEIHQQRNRSQSKQKQHIQALNNHIGLRVKILPKLQGKTERTKHNKFDLQLKMKQKYDKKYKLEGL